MCPRCPRGAWQSLPHAGLTKSCPTLLSMPLVRFESDPIEFSIMSCQVLRSTNCWPSWPATRTLSSSGLSPGARFEWKEFHPFIIPNSYDSRVPRKTQQSSMRWTATGSGWPWNGIFWPQNPGWWAACALRRTPTLSGPGSLRYFFLVQLVCVPNELQIIHFFCL